VNEDRRFGSGDWDQEFVDAKQKTGNGKSMTENRRLESIVCRFELSWQMENRRWATIDRSLGTEDWSTEVVD